MLENNSPGITEVLAEIMKAGGEDLNRFMDWLEAYGRKNKCQESCLKYGYLRYIKEEAKCCVKFAVLEVVYKILIHSITKEWNQYTENILRDYQAAPFKQIKYSHKKTPDYVLRT